MNNYFKLQIKRCYPLLLIMLVFTKAVFSQINEIHEAGDATLFGTAELVNCIYTSGGKMIKGLSEGKANAVLFDNIILPEAGSYFLTVSYYAVNQREITYQLNDNDAETKIIPASGQWCYQGGVPKDFTFQENFSEGENQLLIYDAPIIDKIVISSENNTRSATAFYVSSSGGDNANNGLAPSSPWQSVEKVNSLQILPGDSILFCSGDIFKGRLSIVNEGGSERSPVLFSSYGEGEKPVLDGDGHLSTVHVVNSEYLHFSNLEIKNDGGPAQPGHSEELRYGIFFENTKSDGKIYHHYRLKNLTFKNIYPTINVTDNDQTGVNAYAINTSGSWGDEKNPSRFRDMIIEDCFFTRTARHAAVFRAVDSLTIRNNLFEHVGGAGMVIGNNCTNILVEHNTTNFTGSSIDSRMAGRGSGLWCYQSKNLTVQHNRFMHARGIKDSFGMHIDIGNRNVVYQYNYSENNEGGFVEILGANVNVGYRYNLSIGDGWRARGNQFGKIFWISGWSGNAGNPMGSDSVFIYNNSIYVRDTIVPGIQIVSVTKNTRIYNNIIHAANQFGKIEIENKPELNDFNNNIWFGNISVTDNENETYRGINALTSDPLFSQQIVSDSPGFILREGSPAEKSGKLIYSAEDSGPFNCFHNNGGKDFYGNDVSFTELPNIGAYNGPAITTNFSLLNKSRKTLEFYPNPARNTIYLKGDHKPLEISILNSEGRLIKQSKVKNLLDISDLTPGFYFLKSIEYQPYILIKTQ